MSDPTTATQSCAHCKKMQFELPNNTTLKRCAKCHTQAYCSRECQKDDWENHKRVCTQNNATPTPGSMSNPPTSDLEKHARQTVDLLNALSHDPNFRKDLRSIPAQAAGLKYLADFVSRTFREYWCPLIAPQKFAELSAELESFHGIEREAHLRDMASKFEEVKRRDGDFDKDKWPTLDREKYRDCISRNTMAATIVQNPARQAMMGGSYEYSEEVKEVCRKIMSG
ncbi:hypothetical protein OHC33_003422 [Knufia fluminis]|uniref:MYND-type domain-containing protein n=1 Tax=Knufia fluminis TaxID=191047 RepID=A0AAN8FCJ3_9EURO|nr:hypothetical protein OHC33_003422 [Knufia fluminis]